MGILEKLRALRADRAAAQFTAAQSKQDAYWSAVEHAANSDRDVKPKDVEQLDATIDLVGRTLEQFESDVAAVRELAAAEATAKQHRSESVIAKATAAAAQKLLDHDQAREEFLRKWEREHVALVRGRNDADREHQAAYEAHARAAQLRERFERFTRHFADAPELAPIAWQPLPAQPGDLTGTLNDLAERVHHRKNRLKGLPASSEAAERYREDLATVEFALLRRQLQTQAQHAKRELEAAEASFAEAEETE